MTFTVVDVNGLNGSLSYGMVQAGGRLISRTGYLDLGRYIVRANAKLWGGDHWHDDIEPGAKDRWLSWPVRSHADVVVAVPPCSGFSLLTGKGMAKGTGSAVNASITHPSNDCMWSSARYAGRHAPQVYVFESVLGAFRRGRSMMLELRHELEEVSGHRYSLTHWLHDCVVLGAPTSRQRYMFVAVRGDAPFRVTPVDEYAVRRFTPMREAIDDLAATPLALGDTPIERVPRSTYISRRRRRDGLVDGHWTFTEYQLARGRRPPKWHVTAKQIMDALRGAGTSWRQGQAEPDAIRQVYQHCGWDALVEIEGERRSRNFVQNGFNMGAYFATRGVWDGLCGVISGSGGDSFIHPLHDRLMSLREVARIQGWPDELRIDYDTKTFGKEKILAVWGKAVTPHVAEHAGSEVAAWLEDPTDGSRTTGTLIGDREWLIDDLDHSRRLRRDATAVRTATRDGLAV